MPKHYVNHQTFLPLKKHNILTRISKKMNITNSLKKIKKQYKNISQTFCPFLSFDLSNFPHTHTVHFQILTLTSTLHFALLVEAVAAAFAVGREVSLIPSQ